MQRSVGALTWLMGAGLVAIGCAGQGQPQQRHADLLITGALVIHPDKTQPAQIEDIAVKDGAILAVGKDLEASIVADEIYDATGRYIIPGLADMHSHFGNGILPPGEDDTKEVLARHLYFGNTTILNLGSAQAWPARIDDLRMRIRDGTLAGPRLLAVGSLMTMPGSHPVTTIYSPDLQAQIAEIVAERGTDEAVDLAPLRATTLVSTADQTASEVRRVGDWGANAIKLTVESGPSGFGDDHPQMSPEMIAAAVDAAKVYHIPVLCHISSLDEVEDCLANGANAIVHGVTPDPGDLPDDLEERMVAANFVVIPTAAMFDGWDRYTSDPSLLTQPVLASVLTEAELGRLSSPRMIEDFRSDDAAVESVRLLGEHLKKFHDLGGSIVAGTDTGNPYRFAGMALHEELEFYVKAGLTPREALATATINAARFMNAEDQWGTIRTGLAGDFVILGANPLDDIANTLTIVDVVHNGRIVDRESLPLR